jgi:hypothetical protein
MEYSPEVQRRLRSARWSGFLPDAGGRLVTGEAEDRSLNVWVRFQVEIADGRARSVRFEAYGCPHFIAAADWMAEHLEGRPVPGLGEGYAPGAREALGVPTEKLGKLLVLEDALASCSRAAEVA